MYENLVSIGQNMRSVFCYEVFEVFVLLIK